MIRFATAGVALALFAMALAIPAKAEDASSSVDPAQQELTVPEELQGMVGDWILEQEDELLPRCPITLTDEEAIGGWAVTLPESCAAPYPPADSIVAWNIDETDGSVYFLDAERHVTLRLFEDEDGLFDTAPDVVPRLYLLAPYDEDGSGGEADSE